MVKTYNIQNDCRNCNIHKLIGEYLHLSNNNEIKMINICRDCYDTKTKKCLNCNDDKLFNEFCFNKQTYDGLNKYCKECAYNKTKQFKKDYDPQTYQRYKDYYKEYYKQRNRNKNKKM